MLIGLLLSMYTVNGLKRLMLESMPIASMPSGTKASLIKKLAKDLTNFSVVDLTCAASKGLMTQIQNIQQHYAQILPR